MSAAFSRKISRNAVLSRKISSIEQKCSNAVKASAIQHSAVMQYWAEKIAETLPSETKTVKGSRAEQQNREHNSRTTASRWKQNSRSIAIREQNSESRDGAQEQCMERRLGIASRIAESPVGAATGTGVWRLFLISGEMEHFASIDWNRDRRRSRGERLGQYRLEQQKSISIQTSEH